VKILSPQKGPAQAELGRATLGSGDGILGRATRRTTLLDATHAGGVSGDRSYREQPAGAPGRRELDRWTDWALSHPEGPVPKTARKARLGKQKNVFHFRTGPATTGCSHRRIMADVQAESMVGGTIFHRNVICVRFPEPWSSTSLAKQAVQKHRPGEVCP
jgi:hypothetical protein